MKKIKKLKALPLWMRLVYYFLLLSIVILVLFQVIFNYSLEGHLQAYVRGREETLNSQIVSSLLEYHEATGSWAGILMPLIHTAMSTDTRLLLYDSEGRLLADTGQRGHHMMMRQQMQEPDLSNTRVYQFILEQGNVTIGELFIAHPLVTGGSSWVQQDIIFRRAITRSLLWTGVIAIGAALALGIFFSRHLAYPLEEIAEATERITRGDYSLQLPPYQGRELNGLARCINQLADHLQKLETLRKRSVADIAHELRTPLTTLRSYTEAIKDGVMPADERTVKILQEEIEHLVKVSADLEELTRAENINADQVEREEINVNRFLEDKITSFKPLFRDKGLELRLSLPPKEIKTLQDPVTLRKIISNLLENAYRYTESGGTIEVTLQEEPLLDESAVAPLGQELPADGEKIKKMFLIKISDTGIGIKEEHLPYIFERFFRTDPAREREQSRSGSGIGLALVKELIRTSGGLVTVSSRPGKGTTFYLYMPAGRHIDHETVS